MMGSVAARDADIVVITSDNPRHEDPAAIIADAAAGIDAEHREKVLTEIDRRAAIAAAFAAAQPGDVVVIAGKGHETTQTIGDDVRTFDDRVVARQLLAEQSGHTRGVRRSGDPT
jgi:UDP-N-acetylmuramoyl-L-alanyl-D-glutamate--2,6-diaminopimelate ligase